MPTPLVEQRLKSDLRLSQIMKPASEMSRSDEVDGKSKAARMLSGAISDGSEMLRQCYRVLEASMTLRYRRR